MLLSRHRSARALATGVAAVMLVACSPAVSPTTPAESPGSAGPSGSGVAVSDPDAGTYPPNWDEQQATPINLELFADCGMCGERGDFRLSLPQFRLYANGVVVFRRGPSDSDGTYRWTQLTDDVRDELLRYALDQGGLRRALPRYSSDAEDAGGYVVKFTAFYIDETPNKTVRVGRWFGSAPDPDGAMRGRLMAFADLLTSFEGWAGKHGVAVQPFAPRAYTAAIWPNAEAGDSADWPWTDLQVAGFGEGNGALLARLTPGQAAMIPAEPPNSDGFAVQAPDGTRYLVATRVVLPGDDNPGGFGLRADTMAVTVAPGIRVRSRPEVSDASIKLEPLLQPDEGLYVIDGPIEASGYRWYHVFASRVGLLGWVAAASKERETWIAPVPLACTLGASDQAVVRIMGYELLHLACFKGQVFTTERRIDGGAPREEDCAVDTAGPLDPAWLNDPAACKFGLRRSSGGVDTGSFDLFERAVFHPSVRNTVRELMKRSVASKAAVRVRVSGHLDDPDARGCTGADEAALVTLRCRRVFVISEVVALD